MTNKYFRQTDDVNWLDTPKGTIWVLNDDSDYLQPEDHKLRTNLGVNIRLIDDDDWVWEDIKSIKIN